MGGVWRRPRDTPGVLARERKSSRRRRLAPPNIGPFQSQAFVAFSNMEEAQRACENDKNFFSPKFGERYVRVAIAEDMVPGNLPTLGAAVAAKVRL